VNRRRGTTLMELVICMTIGSSIMLMAIQVTHQAMTASSQALQRSQQERAGARLAQQFRSDVHRASDVVIESEETVRAQLADETKVTYKILTDRVTREEVPKEGPSLHESYDVGDGAKVAFHEIAAPRRIELVMLRETLLHKLPPRIELHAVAVVGKDPHRPVGDSQ
jgi:hypothetical protein